MSDPAFADTQPDCRLFIYLDTCCWVKWLPDNRALQILDSERYLALSSTGQDNCRGTGHTYCRSTSGRLQTILMEASLSSTRTVKPKRSWLVLWPVQCSYGNFCDMFCLLGSSALDTMGFSTITPVCGCSGFSFYFMFTSSPEYKRWNKALNVPVAKVWWCW